MNDFSPYVACNEMRGLLCAEKWKRPFENILVCILSYPGELKIKNLKYCICYEIRVVCFMFQEHRSDASTLHLICSMGHSIFEMFNICNCIVCGLYFILRFNVLLPSVVLS